MEDRFAEFREYQLEKRAKISTMDTIIRNNDDFKESEIDVLLRGYIVLIYAFWEGSYKKIGELFFEVFKEKLVTELPHEIKNSVIIELSTSKNDRKQKIGEISNYNKFISINDNITNVLNKKLLECSDYERTKRYFKSQSNNPDYDKLTSFLKKYNISLKKIIQDLVDEGDFPTNFKQQLDFIVQSRNNIAHGSENLKGHNTYKNYIISNFLSERPNVQVEDVGNFLNNSSYYIYVLFGRTLEEFKKLYMRDDREML